MCELKRVGCVLSMAFSIACTASCGGIESRPSVLEEEGEPFSINTYEVDFEGTSSTNVNQVMFYGDHVRYGVTSEQLTAAIVRPLRIRCAQPTLFGVSDKNFELSPRQYDIESFVTIDGRERPVVKIGSWTPGIVVGLEHHYFIAINEDGTPRSEYIYRNRSDGKWTTPYRVQNGECKVGSDDVRFFVSHQKAGAPTKHTLREFAVVYRGIDGAYLLFEEQVLDSSYTDPVRVQIRELPASFIRWGHEIIVWSANMQSVSFDLRKIQ